MNRNFFCVATLMATLWACDDFGPYQVQLRPSVNFSLKDKSGDFHRYDSSFVYEAWVALNGSNKSVLLRIGDDQFEFKNGTFNSSMQSVTSNFDVSGQKMEDGQRVGISFKRTQICDPECEHVSEYETVRGCTYYIRERERICEIDSEGRRRCRDTWRDVPVTGSQRVHGTETTRRYDINGDLIAERQGHLAQTHGIETLRSETVYPLEDCR